MSREVVGGVDHLSRHVDAEKRRRRPELVSQSALGLGARPRLAADPAVPGRPFADMFTPLHGRRHERPRPHGDVVLASMRRRGRLPSPTMPVPPREARPRRRATGAHPCAPPPRRGDPDRAQARGGPQRRGNRRPRRCGRLHAGPEAGRERRCGARVAAPALGRGDRCKVREGRTSSAASTSARDADGQNPQEPA
jgi:hypothetical protein